MKKDTLRPYSPSSIHFIYLKQYKMHFKNFIFLYYMRLFEYGVQLPHYD